MQQNIFNEARAVESYAQQADDHSMRRYRSLPDENFFERGDAERGRRGLGVLKPLAALALLFVAFMLPGCSPEDPFIPTRTGDTTNRLRGAFLRVIHAAADGPSVNVLVDDSLFFPQPQGYLDFNTNNNNGRYYPVDSNARKITFKSGSQVIGEATLSLQKDQYYSAYLYGSSDKGYRVLVTTDTIAISTDASKRTKYRIVHLSPDSPTMDVRQDSANTTPVITGLQYGAASNYILTREHVAPGTGFWVYETGTGDTIRILTPPYVILPPNANFTIVLTGKSDPRGNDPFLLFSIFQESSRGSDSLFGAPPININFAAIRFANLVASGDSLLDVTFFDPSSEFACNDNFRRNLVGQHDAMEGAASLGLEGQTTHRHYFYVSLLIRQDFPYRVEYHQGDRKCGPPPGKSDPKVYRKQDVLVPRLEFRPEANKRYTVVAYGPWRPDSAHAAVIVDNTPSPPAGMVQVRFFHGAFDALEKKKLRLRIGSQTTPAQLIYGQAPDGTNSFATAPGTPTAQVIDEGGNVVHEQKLDLTPLLPNKAYTIFLSRKAHRNGYHLHALAEDFNPGGG